MAAAVVLIDDFEHTARPTIECIGKAWFGRTAPGVSIRQDKAASSMAVCRGMFWFRRYLSFCVCACRWRLTLYVPFSLSFQHFTFRYTHREKEAIDIGSDCCVCMDMNLGVSNITIVCACARCFLPYRLLFSSPFWFLCCCSSLFVHA